MRKSVFSIMILAFVAIVLLQAVGLLQDFLNWTTTLTHIASTIIIVVSAIILAYIASKLVGDATIRKIIHYLSQAQLLRYSSFSRRTLLQLVSLWVLLQSHLL